MPEWTDQEVGELVEVVQQRLGGRDDLSLLEIIDMIDEESWFLPDSDVAFLELEAIALQIRPNLINQSRGYSAPEPATAGIDSDESSDDASEYGYEPKISGSHEILNLTFRLENQGLNKPLRYSVKELYLLVPQGEPFRPLRERLRLEKTVRRYSPFVSNNAFERTCLYTGIDPKSCPRQAITFSGSDLDQFYGRCHPASDDRLPFGGKPVLTFVKTTKTKVVGFRIDSLSSRKRLTKDKLRYKPSIAGGVKLTPVPVQEYRRERYTKVYPKRNPHPLHSKYWYFKRKRGIYYLSVHNAHDNDSKEYLG